MRGLAFRRAQRERLKRTRRHYWGDRLTGWRLSFVVDTPKPCSCCMCGNPRRLFDERTVQERKADEFFESQKPLDAEAAEILQREYWSLL